MNKIFLRFAPALFVFASAGVLFADDFKSLTFDDTTQPTVRVHGDQFLFIRNFTQEISTNPRGVVTAAIPNSMSMAVKVLQAAALDASAPEVINTVIIAGPADVTFTCGTGGGNCFISYKKEGGN